MSGSLSFNYLGCPSPCKNPVDQLLNLGDIPSEDILTNQSFTLIGWKFFYHKLMQRTLTGTVCAKEYIIPLKNWFRFIRRKKKKNNNNNHKFFENLKNTILGQWEPFLPKRTFPKDLARSILSSYVPLISYEKPQKANKSNYKKKGRKALQSSYWSKEFFYIFPTYHLRFSH